MSPADSAEPTSPEWLVERFKREFNSRTVAYLPGPQANGNPVVVIMGPEAESPAGHVLLSCLINQLARAHNQIIVLGDLDAPILCPSPFGCQTVGEATVETALAINPFISTEGITSLSAYPEDAFIIGVGRVPEADLCVGSDGFLALLGREASVSERPASVWGALLAACLGANAALHRTVGTAGALPEGSYSLWDLGRPGGQDGPSSPGPIDVGRVLQAGAGAVGCALDFAAGLVGVGGEWTILDGDFVDISNLNRQALFLAKDTDWPIGAASGKASTAARRLRALAPELTVHYSSRWYGEDPEVANRSYDVILALANGAGVRGQLQARQPTVLLHATTSRYWQAQAHRHVAGRDDCIDCRIEPPSGIFSCGGGEVITSQGGFDAALPPLSMTAGVLLVGLLARLSNAALVSERQNKFILDLACPIPEHYTARCHCKATCRVRLPYSARHSIDAQSRWAGLDAGVSN